MKNFNLIRVERASNLAVNIEETRENVAIYESKEQRGLIINKIHNQLTKNVLSLRNIF